MSFKRSIMRVIIIEFPVGLPETYDNSFWFKFGISRIRWIKRYQTTPGKSLGLNSGLFILYTRPIPNFVAGLFNYLVAKLQITVNFHHIAGLKPLLHIYP